MNMIFDQFPFKQHEEDERTHRSEIEAKIKEIISQVHTMGNNDIEIPELNLILEKLTAKQIIPTAALKQAQEILDNKEGSH